MKIIKLNIDKSQLDEKLLYEIRTDKGILYAENKIDCVENNVFMINSDNILTNPSDGKYQLIESENSKKRITIKDGIVIEYVCCN